MLKTKELRLKDSNNQTIEITIQQLDWITQNRINDEVTSFDALGKVSIKYGELRIKQMLNSIIKAPFEITEKALKEQDPKLLEEIYKEIVELNKLSDKKKD